MEEPVVIQVETLRRVASILLDHLETVEGSVIAMDHDMFWAIPPDQSSNIYTEPTDFTIGQLADSLQNVDRIAADPSAATSYALVWLADLMRAAGEAVVK